MDEDDRTHWQQISILTFVEDVFVILRGGGSGRALGRGLLAAAASQLITDVSTITRAKTETKQASSTGILLIGLFKLLKGFFLVAVGIGALKLLHKDVAAFVTHWVEIFRVDPQNRFIHPILGKLFRVGPKQLKEIGAGTFFYAALLLIEGVGLLMCKHWAEYFTAITTAALIPLELYEMAHHFTATKVVVLLLNVVIVVYLVMRLRAGRTPRKIRQ